MAVVRYPSTRSGRHHTESTTAVQLEEQHSLLRERAGPHCHDSAAARGSGNAEQYPPHDG